MNNQSNYLLSIIVPVYKVEEYIRPCIDSIFKQGLDDADFEVIIVNDGTPDKSMEIIADIIAAHQNITVINQENQGPSMARNNAMKMATGDYVQFLDSDDLLIDNTLPYLLNNAISSEADLIVADYISMNDNKIIQFKNNFFKQRNGKISKKRGKELFLYDLNPRQCCVWRTLYKREFLNWSKLSFVPNIYYEDVLFTHHCYLKANLCLKVEWTFVIYRRGHKSITSSFNMKKAKDYCVIVSNLWKLSKEKDWGESVCQKIQNDAFAIFSSLFYELTTCRSISHSDRLSVLQTLKKDIPDLAFKNGLKQNIVNFLFHRMPNTYLTLRIFYANYLQHHCWAIGDFIRNKKN